MKKSCLLQICIISILIIGCNNIESSYYAKEPNIINYSQDVITSQNKSITISITAESLDGENLSYQWFKATDEITDGQILVNECSSSLLLNSSQVGIFYYYCEIKNTLRSSYKIKKSKRIKVQVNEIINAKIPIITNISESVNVIVPSTTTFSVNANSLDNGTITYQWYSIVDSDESKCIMIPDATGASYNNIITNSGRIGYYCEIKNSIIDNGDGGTKTVMVNSPVVWCTAIESMDCINDFKILQQPEFLNIISPESKKTSLEFIAGIEADQEPSIKYQWYESEDYVIGDDYAVTTEEGGNSSILVTPEFKQKEIRYYYCIASLEVLNTDKTIITERVISDIIYVAYTGLPLVKIETVDGLKPTSAKEKHNGRMYLIRNNQKVYDSGSTNEFNVKVRGNATATYPKAPYKLKLPKKVDLLESNGSNTITGYEDKNWVLLANYTDKTLLRTQIGFCLASLFNELEENDQLFVPRSEFVDLILNDEYLGNYMLTESIKEGKKRVHVNEKLSDEGGIGFLAEYDFNYYANEPKWFKSIEQSYPYTFKFPDTDDNNFDLYMSVFEEYINSFETSLYNSSSDDEWEKYINIDSFARWYLIQNILGNMDSNYYFYKNSSSDDSKLIMGPVWDFEWSIGIGWYDGERPRAPDYWCANNWYFEKLLTKEKFINALKEQWSKIKKIYPDLAEIINNKMDEIAMTIDISQEMNFKKWDLLNKRVSVGGIPLGSYEAELECDKSFISSRIMWLDNEIQKL